MLSSVLALAMALTPASSSPCSYEAEAVWCDDGETLNGYWWNGWWVPGLPSTESWFTPAPIYSTGRAVWYAPGVMEATADARELSLFGYLDGVAMMSCADVGLPVWINRGFGWEGPYLTVDCAQHDDIWPIIRSRQEVVEVGWRTHQRWGEGIIEVEVSKIPPRLLGDLQPVDYPDWWLKIVQFTRRIPARPLYMGDSRWRIDGRLLDFGQLSLPSHGNE